MPGASANTASLEKYVHTHGNPRPKRRRRDGGPAEQPRLAPARRTTTIDAQLAMAGAPAAVLLLKIDVEG